MIVPEIMRVGFKYIAKTNSGYTAIRILRLIPSPLVIRQGGYETGKSGSWAIAFPHALLGISGDYSGNSGKMEWGPSISGNTTSWSAAGAGSNVRVIAIGY